MHARDFTHSCAAKAWTLERGQECRRQDDVMQLNVLLQRAIAEEHVEKLSGIFTDRRDGQLQGHAISGVFHRLDPGDARYDLLANARVAYRGERQLDALFERERLRSRADIV
ncbi:MAG: hypothetical protein ACREJX_19490 [Polyangiaceae bacterium]